MLLLHQRQCALLCLICFLIFLSMPSQSTEPYRIVDEPAMTATAFTRLCTPHLATTSPHGVAPARRKPVRLRNIKNFARFLHAAHVSNFGGLVVKRQQWKA